MTARHALFSLSNRAHRQYGPGCTRYRHVGLPFSSGAMCISYREKRLCARTLIHFQRKKNHFASQNGGAKPLKIKDKYVLICLI